MTAVPVPVSEAAAAARLPFDLPFLVKALDGDRVVDVVPVSTITPLQNDAGIAVAGRGDRFAAEGRWLRRRPARPPRGLVRWDVELEVTLVADGPLEAGLVVSVRLGATDDPHWLIPGLFYGANRGAGSRAAYPHLGELAGDDPWSAPGWGFRVDRAASPVVFARDGSHGIALATTEVGPLGGNGLGFGMGPQTAGVPELRLTFPYREQPVVYDGSAEPRPADLGGHAWRPGDTETLTFRVYETPAAAYAWAPVLDDVHDELATTSPLDPWLDPAAAAELAGEGLLRWHVRHDPAVIVETAAFERRGDGRDPEAGDRDAMHVAWLSGAPAAAALLSHGLRTRSPDASAAGAAVLDHIAANLAPCGTFWGQWTAERGWTKGWTPGEERLHARTLGEAALFMTRAAAITDDAAAAERWRAAVASNLNFVAAHQRADGAIPASWHARTGAPGSWDGCAGLAWVPALVEGAAALHRPELLAAARRTGEFYARFIDDELLYGAPEDVDLGPTSEDGDVAVMAYVALAESARSGTDRDRWLELATRAASWMLTFRYAWNVAFDPSTTLGRLDYRTRGMDQASPANQHVHVYGLIALAETIRLARLTGDTRLAERSREHFAAARQLIARSDGDFGARRGMMPERAYQTACFGPKGEIGRLSHAWCLGLLLWACEAAAGLPELREAAT